MTSINNKYDDKFKASAVKMVIEKGRAISIVAKFLNFYVILSYAHETVSN